jgi:hypothetical protein
MYREFEIGDRLENIRIDKRILLRWILRKYDVRM